MSTLPVGPEIEQLLTIISRLPGFGPRSARRIALHLLRRREGVMVPLAEALATAAATVAPCEICGNWDSQSPCRLCEDEERDGSVLCVVEDVGDVWALERSGAFKGRYHILGGLISPLDGIGPDDLNFGPLSQRASAGTVREVILALSATVDGQTTAGYVADRLEGLGLTVTRLSHGVPIGGELGHLDEGTLAAALQSRRDFS